ncbi:hypothetical protein GY26_01825 [Gammaproteobacteria bacterium MFB021]|nr:hypothetical protein GY26_01825 [Gammaproteobacteria bacterium MFB021]
MAQWPESLPNFLREGYSEAPVTQTIESSVDGGEPKSRRRFTRGYRNIACRVVVTADQLATFEGFFADESPDAVPFSIPHPRTGQVVQCRITGDPPYTIEPSGSVARPWRVSLTIRTTV